MENWHRLAVVAAVILIALLLSQLVDRAMGGKMLDPAAVTRYRVLRRSIRAGIVFLGILSALLVIPQVRAVAGGILASSAIIGIVAGFAARTTLANVIAGLMIAITQPLRIGDVVVVAERRGVVEEVGLIYTFIRLGDGTRLVVPNEQLASDTIENSTIRGNQAVAQVSVQVPLGLDLEQLVGSLEEALASEPGLEVYVSELSEKATLHVRVTASGASSTEAIERRLRLRVHEHLRSQGALA